MTSHTPHLPPLSNDPTNQAFAVRGLFKQFGSKVAVNNLSLDVPYGSIFGLVGPNGAGKTTLISLATGLLRPDAGQAWIAGSDIWSDGTTAKQKMGLLADGVPVFDRLSGPEYLEFLGGLRNMDPQVIETRSRELLQTLGLEEAKNTPITDYSAGMTKKILLAGALLHAPKLLILDEPLEAVDPASGRTIQRILRNFAANGGTIILSSHVMELVEGLCDHLAIVDHGQILTMGSVDEVRQGTSLVDAFIDFVGGDAAGDSSLEWLKGSE
ncbi:ABC transporter ATP-binding protein [Corynebacterium pseudotuberculosis]|uniref:ABC transporter ATP-binding protein n=1 Tax=Corynebacterium pseudotuberculosis TaxID=1719 RepID=UPI0001DD45CC|nr:ABC transporter ATP-binding protein [Corynebacterium pseudotuberculosis]ADK29670.1 ATP-binding cassette domain-containing protein [Corynebacterium pseudotuberculosis FRC41]ADL21737.1 ABC transporter ATP-binding protein [Corynebacterium pseudotuberculosis 1002]AEX40377.1 ABC transporter domain-containing ATP-binding subunit [Corynebacterium pseudotuberculosis 3/99-5]AIG06090.1 ABC-type multidrug transport system, ATPase component [Corynebacterium pseudotuberculosis]AIG09325.1 ABC-type multid